MGGNAPVKLITQVLGLGGAGVAAWMATQSAKGRLPEWQRQVANHHTDLSMDEMQYHWGHYSGQPTMDTWAGKFKRLMLFGPLGINTTWHKIKTYTEGFVNDVLLKNFIPIAAGLGGLYATGFKPHQIISKPFGYLNKHVLKPAWRSLVAFGTKKNWSLGNMGRALLSGKYGVEAACRVMARNPAVSLALGALAAFGIYRFNRVYNHEEQHDFFAPQITGGDH